MLATLLEDIRGEWPHALFGSLFIQPAYFTKLLARRPCLLIGGRGTGKTTTLRSLRFDAAIARLPVGDTAASLTHFGIYVRINKNRVRAFSGDELTPKEWSQAFAHYFNLLACQEMCSLCSWLEKQAFPTARAVELGTVAASFGLSNGTVNASILSAALEERLAQLELFVNNPKIALRPMFSMAEAPLKNFATALEHAGYMSGRTIFCCVDEYENLTPEQQSIINTYVKHAEPPLTYKLGVRRNGLRTRSTIDNADQMATPDDYAEIDIANESFDDFAIAVVELRLKRARQAGLTVPESIHDFLAEVDLEEEATLLGSERIAASTREQLKATNDGALSSWADRKSDWDLAFLAFWSAGHGPDATALARDWMATPDHWHTRLGNYGHACLFWLSHGRKGGRIRKYYAGANALLHLSSGNIRYFLELIDESIQQYLAGDEPLGKTIAIPADAQTHAARAVGRRRLGQLEGLSQYGVDLKRFVLAIGKVFFEFARDPKKAPETNAFVVVGSPEAREEVSRILEDGVGHLAFEVTPRTKATSDSEMKDEEYRVHPIYAAFFEYSYRRKRRTTFRAEDLLLLRSKPAKAIRQLLGDSAATPVDEAPPQLHMFAKFYEAPDE